jgi:hypothetical protein
MKIALYIEDGLEQIVLTPQSPTEKGILNKLHDQQKSGRALSIHRGGFYECNGGWMRHDHLASGGAYETEHGNDASTIVVLRPAKSPSTEER